MPIKDPIIRKEYARLSMLIKYTRDRGEDTSQLLDQRKSIIKGIRYNSIKNTSGIIPSIRKKSISIKPSNQLLENVLNEVKQIKEQNNLLQYELSEYFKEKEIEQKQTTNNFLNELSNLKRELSNQLKQTISKLQAEKQAPIKTINEKPKKREIKEKKWVKVKKVSPTTNPTAKSDKITFRFNQELEKQIQSFLAKNSQSFPSFSHFVRYALLSYKDGMEIDREQQFNKFSIKKSPRMNEELQNIHHSLPAGQKSLIFNQILASFLMKESKI